MNETSDNRIEKLIDSIMKDAPKEQPSVDFTANVMSQLALISNHQSTVYKPLISKKVWGLLVIIVVSLIVFLGVSQPASQSWFQSFDLNSFGNHRILGRFAAIQISGTTKVSIVMFAVMLMIQIPILKRYFDSRI